MDESAWARYRERVRRDWADGTVGRKVEQRRVIEELLVQAAELDAQVTQVARSLNPDDFRAFLDMLTLMREAEFKAASGDGGESLQEWGARTDREMAAGQVPLERQPAISRMINVLGLPDKAVTARQFAPACPAATPLTGPDPVVYATAVEPLLERYSAAQPRVVIGSADEALVEELAVLAGDFQKLRYQQPAGGETWKVVQWYCAMVTGSLARSAALLRHTDMAVEKFIRAADEWQQIGKPIQAADCLARAAESARAAGADVDAALEPLLERVGPPELETGTRVVPTIVRARMLAQLALVYFGAGDHSSTGVRVEESARTLVALGFADPGALGVQAAFAHWVGADPGEDVGTVPENRTSDMLMVVAEIWGRIAMLRTELGTGGGDLVYQLDDLARRLATETRQVRDLRQQEAVALGIVTSPNAPGWDAAAPIRKEAADKHAWLSDQQLELHRLRIEAGQCEDPGKLPALLARADALERRLLAGNVTGVASAVVSAGILHSDLLSQLGRLDEAAEVLGRIKRRLTEVPGGTVSAEQAVAGLAGAERRAHLVAVIGRAAAVAARQDDFHRVSRLCGEGIAEAELDRGKVNGPYLQDGYLRNVRHLYNGGVFAAWLTGDHELMLARSELAKARGVLGWAVTDDPAGEIPSASQHDEQAFHELTRALAGSDGVAPNDAERAHMTARRRVLWERLMTRRSRSGVQDLKRFVRPAFSVAAVQAALAPDEAVTTYHWVADGPLLVVTIGAGGLAVEEVVMDEARRAHLAGVAARMGELTQDGTVWLEQESGKLGQLLPQQQGRELLAGKQRLIVSPHRLLHQLPFHAFGFDGGPLAERFAVSYVPNLTSLLLPAVPAADGVFALGVSSFGPGREPLPQAGPEAEAVAELYRQADVPVTLLTDADGQATVGRINELRERGSLGGFGTLHLVTHGDDVPVSAPFEAGLHLPDGKIDGLEISQWRLRADLVVLSACHSARRAVTGRPVAADGQEELFGDEVLGLQAAFFAAGARQVLGALWPVSDTAGRRLMCAFHQYLIVGRPAESALRQAMLDMRDRGWPMFHWAPYKLVRLGRAGREAATT